MDQEDLGNRDSPAAKGPGLSTWFEQSLVLSRYLVLIPVVVLIIAALGAFVYAAYLFVLEVKDVVRSTFPASAEIGQIMMMIDLFLIGATLLIAGFGFYELFIGRLIDKKSGWLPMWLQMRDLNDLKARVIAMIVLIASVDFVEVLVDSPNGNHILERGVGIALVIAALTGFLRFGNQSRDRH